MAKYDKNGYITKLDQNEVFVFGSNGQGAHLGGAAATAVQKFGAKMGQAEGLQGQSYAINTMDSEDEMFAQIDRFLKFAEEHPEYTFLVTEIGCGIAGYSPEQIAPKFANHSENVILPDSFNNALGTSSEPIPFRNRARGMLVGLAVGDALGAPVEFGFSSTDIKRLGDKAFHFYDNPRGNAGEWTDDTSMALCIADSLLECGGYDSYDMMDRFYRWVKEGYRSHDGLPADDVGNQTRLEIIKYHRDPVRPKDEPKTESAGNAPIMRLAPIVIANVFPNEKHSSRITDKELNRFEKMAILSCQETHNSIAAECVTGMFATALYAAMLGFDKTAILSYAERGTYLDNKEYDKFWLDNVDSLINRWRNKNDGDNLKDLGGYIVDAFAIALWGFANSESFEDGMKKVILLSGDVDTNAAIYGQLAGAYYGYESIPEEWRNEVENAKEIVEIADNLLAMKKCPIIRTRFEDSENFSKDEIASMSDTIKNHPLYKRLQKKK